jgi:hypothetical protein
MTKILSLVTACAATVMFAGPVLADRAPTPEERTAIEDVLKKSGYTRWEEIEHDDGMWEVDDARGSDGVEYDLKLDPRSLEIVKKTRDS